MKGLLISLLLIGFAINIEAQESVNLTLDDCIKYALENNEQLEIARLDNEIARTQINETLARGLPQVNGSVGLVKNFEIQTSFIQDFISPAVYGVLIDESLLPDGTQIPEPQTFPAAFETEYSGQAGLTARQLIFDGSYFVGLKAAQTVKLLSQREQKQTEVQIVEGVSKAYYLVLITKENLDFLGRNFGTIDTLLQETEAMYEVGFAEKIDVSRLKIQHNNIKTELKNNTELLITSLNLLKFQMGMPLNQRIALTDDLSNISLTPVTEPGGEYHVNRPEYDVLQTNKDLIDLNIKNFQSQYIPNIYANFNFGWTAGTNSFSRLTEFNDQTWFRYSNLGVTLSIPIFDGLSKRANIQRNRIQKQQVEESISQFENNVDREVAEAKVKVDNAIRSVETQSENVELAEEVYEMTKAKYQEGIGSNLEVIEANTSLKESKTNYLNALYEAATSQIELKKALGTLYNN
ncbi:TolC family protein [Ekhidna sp.]|jgi:outer membrane protein|uniref:TolC family protein n=1 Tax=Ekhidna sp. TaxID=2608089 RepID=UPI0032EFB46C